jgi:hypothetical protein
MSWTSPKTWVATNILTAAELNTHVRDNFNAAIPVTSTITTTGTQTALAVPDGRGDLVIFCNNASLLTLQGITAVQNGQTLTLVSIGAGNVDIENQSGSASAANKIINPVTGTITLAAGVGRVTLVYDSTTSRWRVIAHEQGTFITPAFSAGNFTASGGGTWTVASGDVTTFAYYLSGKLLTVQFYIQTTTVSGTPVSLIVGNGAFGGYTFAKTTLTMCLANNAAGGNEPCYVDTTASGTTFTISQVDGGTWSNSTDQTYAFGVITVEVA